MLGNRCVGSCSMSGAASVTGTLTQNEMVFKRLHLGTVAYGLDSMDEVQSHIFSIYTQVELNCVTSLFVHKTVFWVTGLMVN